MLGGLQPAAGPSALAKRQQAAAMDQYAAEQLSTRLHYVFDRLDSKGDGLIDADELGGMLGHLGCAPRKKLKGDRETVMCVCPRARKTEPAARAQPPAS